MALKIRLKPEQTALIGKSHVTNAGEKACELVIDGDEVVVRDIHDPKAQRFAKQVRR